MQKLKYLYHVRDLCDVSNAVFMDVNNSIIAIEQSKINNATNSKIFIEKPDWLEIISAVSSYGSNTYWIERQNDFFKSTNNCMRKYQGKELSACFASIITKQNTLNQQLLQQEQMKQENIYRQRILEQNDMMINLQLLQDSRQNQMNNTLQNINDNIQRQNFNQMQMNNSLQQINNQFLYRRF